MSPGDTALNNRKRSAMNTEHKPSINSAPDETPLPAELRSIDARLARVARRSAVPRGLADRVFAASVSDLPTPALISIAEAQPAWRRPSILGRVAVAAAITVTAMVTAPAFHSAGSGSAMAFTLAETAPTGSEVLLVALTNESAPLELWASANSDPDVASIVSSGVSFDDLAREMAEMQALMD
jgi:hypothetical protein